MLRIGNRVWNKQTGKPRAGFFLSQTLPLLNALPEPELASSIASPIQADEAVICLQQEMAYVDLMNPIHNIKKIKYVGSKDVRDCILVYLHTETDHLVVHVDATSRRPNLRAGIAKFTYMNKIQVYLAGGLDEQCSVNNIKKIINELYDVAIRSNIKIHITKQKLLRKNKLDNYYQTVFDDLVYKAGVACRQLYNETVNEQDFSTVSANDFKTRTRNFTKQIDTISHLRSLVRIEEVYNKNDIQNYNLILKKLAELKKIFPTKDELISAIKSIICVEGFNDLSKHLNEPAHHVNFVFDIETKKMHVINQHLKTVDEKLRHLYSIHNYNVSERKFINNSYFVCYSGRLGLWNSIPIENKVLAEKSEAICALASKEKSSREDIKRLTGWNDGSIDGIVEASQYCISNFWKSERELFANMGFFSFKETWEDMYENDTIIGNGHLEALVELTKLPFVAKFRRNPVYTVDALCELPTQEAATQVKELLRVNKVYAHVIKLENKTTHSFQVCVPAINAGIYARLISRMRSSLNPTPTSRR